MCLYNFLSVIGSSSFLLVLSCLAWILSSLMSNAELLAGKTPTLFETQMSLLICRFSFFSVYPCYLFLFHLHILF